MGLGGAGPRQSTVSPPSTVLVMESEALLKTAPAAALQYWIG